jgi:hypothetical protein
VSIRGQDGSHRTTALERRTPHRLTGLSNGDYRIELSLLIEGHSQGGPRSVGRTITVNLDVGVE